VTHYTARNLPQTCLYWRAAQNDGYGTYIYDDPIELDCRWEDVTLVDELAREVQQQLRSEVILNQDVEEQGMLMLGELVDLDSDEFNDPVSAGASMIVRFDKIPTLKGDYFFRKAYVGRLVTTNG
jgi:hypothetical protein